MVRDTSEKAYKEINLEGVSGNQHRKILNFLRTRTNLTRREIAQATGIEISAVAGRVNELIKVGSLSENGIRRCSISGRIAHTLSL